MLSGNGLEVGSVFARIGALFDDDGFDKYRRAVKDAREEAKREIKPDLEADFNSRGFDQFGKALKEARVEGGKDVKPDLGGDFNGRGFQLFDRAVKGARSERDVSTDLKADVDEAGFRKYDRALRSARNESDITTRAGIRTGAGFVSVGKSAAGAAVAFLGTYGLVEGVKSLYNAYRESERVQQQTEAVLRSTGEEANVTADHVGDLATKFSVLAAEDDEAIQAGENFLLTFTNIRNEVGKGNNIFDRATLAVLNMSVALDQDMKSGSIQLGKALNDPIKGITALSRVGVAFTDQTKERIETLVEEGDTLSAQKIILKELETEFGGSAKAAGEGASGMDRLKVSAENLQESLGAKLAPTLSTAAGAVADFFDSLGGGKGKGKSEAGKTVKRIVGEIGDALAPFKDEVGAIAGTVGRLFRGVGDVLSETFGGESGIGGDLAEIGNRLRDFGQFVLRLYNNIIKRALPGIITAFRGLAQVVRGVVRVIAGILTLDFAKAWDGVKDIFSGAIKLLGGTLRLATAPFREAASAIGRVLIGAFEGAWDFIEGIFKAGIDKLLGLFTTGLRKIADVMGASPDIPGIPDPQDAANEVNKLADSIDGYRESLRDTDDEQKTARQRTRDHIAALKDERRELRATNASHQELRRNKRQLSQAQDELNRETKQSERGFKGATGWGRNWAQQLKTVGQRAKGARGETRDLQRTIRDPEPTNAFAKGLRRLIRGSGNFQGALGRAVDYVKDATNKALTGFGAKPLNWIVQAAKDVGDLLGFARGGFIGQRGQKGKDKRLVLAGDGEAFFNGDQIPYVEEALRSRWGVNLGQFFNGHRWRPHSQTRGYEQGGVVDGFASGGQVFPRRSYPGLSGDTDFNPSLGIALSQMAGGTNRRIYVTSGGRTTAEQTGLQGGPNPAAAPGASHHEFVNGAIAADIAPGYEAFGSVASRYGLTFPLLGIGEPWHIELAGGASAAGATIGTIPKLRIKGPAGAQRTILQNAADQMVKGANAYLSRQGGAGGGVTMLPAGELGSGSPDENRALGQRMLQSSGMTGWSSLEELWNRESGWEETATNPTSGAYGIPQALPASKLPPAGQPPASGGAAAAAQIGWGLDYISGRYGSPAAALAFHNANNWYSGGGIVEGFAQGGQVGQGKTKVKPQTSLGIAEPAGPVRVAAMGPLEAHLGADGGKFVAFQEAKLSDLEADYTYWERRFNLSEEEFIVEGDDGAPVLNRDAIQRRVEELKKLLSIRKAIIAIRNREIAFAKRTIELLRPVIKALKQGLNAAQSKTAREKWRDALGKYTGQLSNWKGQLGGWQSDKRERITDRDEILGQLKALAPGGSVETEYGDALADFTAGLESDEGLGDTGTGEGAPTPEQIAVAAREQLNEFQSQRASLYGEFGSNFVPAGTVPFQTAIQQAAGMAHYGVMGASTPGSIQGLIAAAKQEGRTSPGGGGVLFQLKQDFKAPPPDPHTWTKSVLFELGAQL